MFTILTANKIFFTFETMPDQPQFTPPISRKRILAADDDPIMREMIKARLGDDTDVTCAENGEIAWEKLLEENFDLAIIDLGMPKLDGFGLIRYLRQTPKTVDLPIIVATSRGDAQAIENAFASGASGFVTKPINWSLFKYNVQFILKTGLIERQLRASQTANDLITRTKDKLLDLMSVRLQNSILPNDHTAPVDSFCDIVELSRLLISNPERNFTHHNVNEIIGQAMANCQTIADEKSINLVGRNSLADISISVDQSIWASALTRLVLFAIKSSPAGGTVEIMLGSQPDGSLVTSVRDNGPINSQAEIDARLNVLIDSKTDRTLPDLNLPIVKQSAEIHGGKILFQNNPGGGNIAALWLPANRVNIKQR